jgi:hypothetical protein
MEIFSYATKEMMNRLRQWLGKQRRQGYFGPTIYTMTCQVSQILMAYFKLN